MLGRLKERQDFLAVFQKGVSVRLPSVIVQACPVALHRNKDGQTPCVFGFTASRKVGNAVLRNKAKRRLRVCATKFQLEDGGTWPAPQELAVPLSRRTLNHLRSQAKAASATGQTAGWAFVFVATKQTPVIEWGQLVADTQKAMAGCRGRWLARAARGL